MLTRLLRIECPKLGFHQAIHSPYAAQTFAYATVLQLNRVMRFFHRGFERCSYVAVTSFSAHISQSFLSSRSGRGRPREATSSQTMALPNPTSALKRKQSALKRKQSPQAKNNVDTEVTPPSRPPSQHKVALPKH